MYSCAYIYIYIILTVDALSFYSHWSLIASFSRVKFLIYNYIYRQAMVRRRGRAVKAIA